MSGEDLKFQIANKTFDKYKKDDEKNISKIEHRRENILNLEDRRNKELQDKIDSKAYWAKEKFNTTDAHERRLDVLRKQSQIQIKKIEEQLKIEEEKAYNIYQSKIEYYNVRATEVETKISQINQRFDSKKNRQLMYINALIEKLKTPQAKQKYSKQPVNTILPDDSDSEDSESTFETKSTVSLPADAKRIEQAHKDYENMGIEFIRRMYPDLHSTFLEIEDKQEKDNFLARQAIIEMEKQEVKRLEDERIARLKPFLDREKELYEQIKNLKHKPSTTPQLLSKLKEDYANAQSDTKHALEMEKHRMAVAH